MEIKNELTEKKGAPGAKDVSLKSMIVTVAWVGLLSAAKALWGLFTDKEFGLSMGEIVLSGLIMAAAFSPVYLSILLDKIKALKVGQGV